MAECYAADPGARLTFDGERFNKKGSILMAETIIRAMDQAAMITPQLRQIWDERTHYAER